MEHHHLATGVRCPGVGRMPDAPPRTRLEREVQSAALPSLNPPEKEGDALPDQPEEDRDGLPDLPKHLRAPADYFLNPPSKLPSSVIIPKTAEFHPPRAIHSPARLSAALLSSPTMHCPVLLRAALRGEEGGRGRCCCCSPRLMPALTDLEYDAFVRGQSQRSEQVLLVACVTSRPRCPGVHVAPNQDALERLYERMNRNRTMPCKQMYVRGKLLFADNIFNGYSCSIRDLHKQIFRTRRDSSLGLSLPPDYKFRLKVKSPPATRLPTQQEPRSLDGEKRSLSTERSFPNLIYPSDILVPNRKTAPCLEETFRRSRDMNTRAKKAPALPRLPVFMP
ncbi:uncharacterized protein C3orf20 homolog [Lampris incognitus]|uniref:uncharacterized protein C3orf20 homolog n=1 Tax=Lampris incognitus TaxID=2546036 RepID=UPI0024B5DDED|nr:uncharacterized protein C3orf20 homolog [Lampris incognitus]